MKLLKRGRQIGQAVKNVQRFQTILGVFVRHGFADVLHRANLGKFLPKGSGLFNSYNTDLPIEVRLRLALEELGPTFIKFGQILSTRSDLLSEDFISELSKLQDNVQVLPGDLIKDIIEKQLGKSPDEIFQSFNSEPLAAASISQVHEATLKTGDKVVVKVQRPEIRKIIDTDISLMAFIASMLEKYVPETRIANPTVFVDEFFRSLQFELDFKVEANNMIKISENLSEFSEIVIPKVYREFSSERVLTLEKLEGIRLKNTGELKAAGVDTKRIVEIGTKAFFKSVMLDGLFHGDLHGGNLFVLPGNKLGIIDFGIVGRLSEKARSQLANMVLAILTEDFEVLCYQYAELGAAPSSINFDDFQREIRNALSPYMGLSLSEMNTGKILMEATKIATKYRITIPGDWMIVFKAILTMEGMGLKLDPDFNMIEAGKSMIKELVKKQYSIERLSKEALWIGKELAALMQTLPRQLRWMFRQFNRNDFAFEIRTPELRKALEESLEENGKRNSFSIASAGLFIAGAIALPFPSTELVWGLPMLSSIFFCGGGLLLLRNLLK